MKTQNADPLRFIPSATAIRARLSRLEEELRKLTILLRTAEEIEAAEQDGKKEESHG